MTEDINAGLEKLEIIERISEIFFRYGIRSCSMDDIARHLKMSKKTLYDMFENKNDVVDQVLQYRKSLGAEAMSGCDFSDIEPIPFMFEKLDVFTDKYTSQMPNNFFDIKKYHPEIYKKHFKQTDENNLQVAMKFLDRGIAGGVFRENINKEAVIHLMSRQMMSLADPDVVGEMKTPMDEIVVTIIENFIRSIATPKGVAQLEEILKKRELEKTHNK